MSGVSSMMTSTPVASSNARMFRPSRPMMRPFISSFGSETADTVVSAVVSAAIRWMASATIFLASRSAFRRALSRISRSVFAASACASSSIRRISSVFASWADMPAICSSRRRSSATSFSSSSSRVCTSFSRRPKSLARPTHFAVPLLDRLRSPIERALPLADTTLLDLDGSCVGCEAPPQPSRGA